jgi:hypothetical protein
MACKTTSGCDLAGVISVMGLFSVNSAVKTAHLNKCAHGPVNTYAAFAAPKMPNLIGSLFFSTVNGKKAVKRRFNSVAILL